MILPGLFLFIYFVVSDENIVMECFREVSHQMVANNY